MCIKFWNERFVPIFSMKMINKKNAIKYKHKQLGV